MSEPKRPTLAEMVMACDLEVAKAPSLTSRQRVALRAQWQEVRGLDVRVWDSVVSAAEVEAEVVIK